MALLEGKQAALSADTGTGWLLCWEQWQVMADKAHCFYVVCVVKDFWHFTLGTCHFTFQLKVPFAVGQKIVQRPVSLLPMASPSFASCQVRQVQHLVELAASDSEAFEQLRGRTLIMSVRQQIDTPRPTFEQNVAVDLVCIDRLTRPANTLGSKPCLSALRRNLWPVLSTMSSRGPKQWLALVQGLCPPFSLCFG